MISNLYVYATGTGSTYWKLYNDENKVYMYDLSVLWLNIREWVCEAKSYIYIWKLYI